jgi:hypothetical protein
MEDLVLYYQKMNLEIFLSLGGEKMKQKMAIKF